MGSEMCIRDSPWLGTVMRKSAIDEVGMCDEGLTYCDWYLWLRLARRWHFKFVDGTAGLYRRHGTSMVATARPTLRADRLEILRRMSEVFEDPRLREAATLTARWVAREAWYNGDPRGRKALGSLLEVLSDRELRVIQALWSVPIPRLGRRIARAMFGNGRS